MRDETEQDFFDALMEFGNLSQEGQDRVISGLAQGSDSLHTDVDCSRLRPAEPQLIPRTRSELEDVLNWKRERLVI
jgi:hypothetical protein